MNTLLLTVPHSGTRYAMKAAAKAGEVVGNIETLYQPPFPKLTFAVGHPNPRYEESIQRALYEEWPDRFAVLLRDPIMTWATHWAGMDPDVPASFNRKFTLRNNYERMLQLVKLHNPEIHRIEDGLASLGLPEHEQTFSEPTPLKKQVEARNLREMFELTRFSGWFAYMRNEVAPIIRDFYEEHGYDFWWL